MHVLLGGGYIGELLVQIDLDGQAMNLMSVELKSSDRSYSHRYGWTYVKSKAPNIHLFSQSVVGRDGEGPVLVTMFDTSLALRTWRNYTAPIRVESANIDGNFFLFGGQVPVESGGEGFALLKVNSANAIVEQFKNFKKELKNSSIATSSASLYDRGSDKIWTMIKPNGGNENDLILLENQAVIDHECSEDLSSSVAKDPIDIKDMDMVATPLELTMTKLDCNRNEVKLLNKEICSSSGTDINFNINLSIFPNPFNDHLTVESDQMIEHIEILSVDGRPHKSFTLYDWDVNQLTDGNYDLRVVSNCELADKNSDIHTGVIDRINPHPFGNPTPADGILSPNDEISIKFNEPIDLGSINQATNFDIRGVLNNTTVDHNISLSFDGVNDFAEIPTGVPLDNRSFTIEFSVLRDVLGEQAILCQGIDSLDQIYIGFDANNKLVFKINNNTITSVIRPFNTVGKWHNIAISYDVKNDQVQFYEASSTTTAALINSGSTTIVPKYIGNMPMEIGKKAGTNNKFFNGNLQIYH